MKTNIMSNQDANNDCCSSEDGNHRTENSKCGLRQGKRFPAQDFRRKAGEQLQENKYHINQWCEP
jgi:hypothetical protein